MANRQCQLWAGIFIVDPALKLKTTHSHRRYLHVQALYARECGGHETSCQCFSNAGPPSSMATYIAPALAWRLLVACAYPVLHPDLSQIVLLCSYPAGYGGVCFAIYSRLISLNLSSTTFSYIASTRTLNIILMLVHCLRRWPNI